MTDDDIVFLFAVTVAAGFLWFAYIVTREGLRSLLHEWRQSKTNSVFLVLIFLGAAYFAVSLDTDGLFGRFGLPSGLYGLGVCAAAVIGMGIVECIMTGRLP